MKLLHTQVLAALGTISIALGGTAPVAALDDSQAKAIVSNYADIALAKYSDSLATAKALDGAIDAFIAKPSAEGLASAKEAWIAARVPYQQTEVYRFGNAIVDDWEGRVNAWPLDEGLIDYVVAAYGTESDENNLYTANVIANGEISINGKAVDASAITPEFLSSTLHEAGGIEANVATGYHAIEFLLWGQDTNGTGPGAGKRPHTDFDTSACTGGNCDRRTAYLVAASDLLIADLEEMVSNWEEGGAARKSLMEADAKTGLSVIVTGMGSLSYGELAGERMKLGLLLHDPEEEHDCFADNTHASHFNDVIGIRNVYLGKYEGVGSTMVAGASLSDAVKAASPELDAELRAKLDSTVAAMQAIVDRAEGGEAYDQQIGEGNAEGNATVQTAIDSLVDQTKSIERVLAALDLEKIEFEGSDSLDDPDAVFE